MTAPSAERLLRIVETCREIIVAASNINRSMRVIVEKVAQITNAEGATIAFPEGNEIVGVAASRRLQSHLGLRVPIEASFPGLVFSSGQVQVVHDGNDDPRVTPIRVKKLKINGIVGVPLLQKSHVVGVLLVFAREEGGFGNEDVTVITMLGQIVSAAIEHARSMEEMYRESRHDSLTGLNNRRAFDETIKQELMRLKRYNVPFSLILYDLDDFKGINDRYGHIAGDEVLRTVGAAFKQQMRDTDTAFRFGGDEFAILCSSTHQPQALLAAERISKALSGVQATYTVSASYGVSEAKPEDDILQLEARADAGLYDAKRMKSTLRTLSID